VFEEGGIHPFCSPLAPPSNEEIGVLGYGHSPL